MRELEHNYTAIVKMLIDARTDVNVQSQVCFHHHSATACFACVRSEVSGLNKFAWLCMHPGYLAAIPIRNRLKFWRSFI
jgi:hypothetical protein